MSGETAQGEQCGCHPECERSCRVESHPPDNPCLWPDCLTWMEMREMLRELRNAGVA